MHINICIRKSAMRFPLGHPWTDPPCSGRDGDTPGTRCRCPAGCSRPATHDLLLRTPRIGTLKWPGTRAPGFFRIETNGARVREPAIAGRIQATHRRTISAGRIRECHR
jgi:hypothetical protein